MVAKGEGGGGGKNWECGISRCKLLHIEWINNKVLLYRTENYIQYTVINHNEKEKQCLLNEKFIDTYVFNKSWPCHLLAMSS